MSGAEVQTDLWRGARADRNVRVDTREPSI